MYQLTPRGLFDLTNYCNFCKDKRECVYLDEYARTSCIVPCPVCRLGPFDIRTVDGQPVSAEGRERMVQSFGMAACKAALDMPGLQVAVRQAVERRLRELERLVEQSYSEAGRSARSAK